MYTRTVLALLVLVFIVTTALSQEDDRVVVVTHDSFAASETALQAFEAHTGLTVDILRAGDAGAMVNQSILSVNNPLGDVLYGIDNTFLSRALDAEIFVPYESPELQFVDESFVPEVDHLVTPIDYGDVCLNYDIAYFGDNELDLPSSLADLTLAEYRGLLVVENPATSSPGLAFLLATIAVFGAEGDYTFLDYWRDLRSNDVLVVDGWTEAYYGEFSAPGRDTGTRPLVVSYASSPPAEVLFSENPEDGPFTGALVGDDMCFRQVEYAGVLVNAANPEGARLFVDFMLSPAFQEDLPLNMFVFPVREDILLPDIFAELATIPEQPAALDPAEIETNREDWIRAWSEVMLR
ncbi:MAG: thiamine ABC transporter substrate-binding protein [Chloroflexi bacterium]|nr:thiamine ABC transporter substrate-binding protein [Chloroflexota bacterium]